MKLAYSKLTGQSRVAVTFFTSGKHGRGYESLAPKWIAAVEQQSMDYLVFDAGSLDGWRRCTMLKPGVIYDSLLLTQRDIMWIDIDGEVKSPLSRLDHVDTMAGDLALCIRPSTIGPRWSSASVYFRQTSAAYQVVLWWKAHCQDASVKQGQYADLEGDQEVLAYVCLERRPHLALLPIEYCWIDCLDKSDNDPVIIQGNASKERADDWARGLACHRLPPERPA